MRLEATELCVASGGPSHHRHIARTRSYDDEKEVAMSSTKTTGCLARTLLLVLFVLLDPLVLQAQVVENQPRGDAIQPAQTRDYKPCSWTADNRSAMCLQDRLDLVLQLEDGRFQAVDGLCRLTFPEKVEVIRYECGGLLVALRPGLSLDAWNRILAASDGKAERRRCHPNAILLTLKVHPGSERYALYNIVFEPDVLWVDFNRIRIFEVLAPRASSFGSQRPQRTRSSAEPEAAKRQPRTKHRSTSGGAPLRSQGGSDAMGTLGRPGSSGHSG